MKKIFSLIMVIVIISLSAGAVLAAPLADKGLLVTFDEAADGLITGTVSLSGGATGIGAIGGLQIMIKYPKASYNVVDKNGSNPVTAAPLTDAAFAYADFTGSALDATWVNNGSKITYAATSYIGLGTMTSTATSRITVASNQTATLFKFYLKRVSGYSAALTAADLTLSTSTTSYAYYVQYVGVTASSTTYVTAGSGGTVDAAKFGVVVNPLAAGFVVTYDPANGGAITTPTQSTFVFPADPVKQGYDFAGWYYNGTKYTNGSNVTANVTLTASYTFNSATAPADPKSGSIDVKTSPSTTGTVTAAKIMTIGGKIPAGAVAGEDFGIIINGKKFQSLSDPANCPGGLFIIKLVDVTGNVLTGSYNAFNYYKTTTSLTPVVVSGQ